MPENRSHQPDDDVQWLSDDEQHIWRSCLMGQARVAQYLSQQLRPSGLDLAEYEILVQLSESPDRRARMSHLAEGVHQSRSRLTHTITRMEKAGLVTRQRCKGDGRGVWAELTDEGMDLIRRTAPGHVQAVRDILITPIGAEGFAALGRAMEAVLATTPDADNPPTPIRITHRTA